MRSKDFPKSKVISQLKKLGMSLDSESDYETASSEADDTESGTDSDNSDSDSVSVSSKSSMGKSKKKTKKNKKSSKKKSVIKSKSSDHVSFPQIWPHTSLQFEFVNKSVRFPDLSFSLLVEGELEIITDCHSKSERLCRLELLKKLAYYYNTYTMAGLKNYYSACLRQIEKGQRKWGDDLSHLEQPILGKHLLAKGVQKGKSSSGPKEKPKGESEGVFFCYFYNRNKCLHSSDHTALFNYQLKICLHVYATCWKTDRKKLQHAEFSKDCLHAVSK